MPRIIAWRCSGVIDWAAATSCAVGPRRRGAAGCRSAGAAVRRQLGETVGDGLPPRRIGGRVGQQSLQFLLGAGGVAVLQRRLGAVIARARIVGRLGELGLGRRRHRALGLEHQHLAELGVQTGVVGRQGEGMVVGVERLGKAARARPRCGRAGSSL